MSRLILHKRITKGVSFLTNMLLPGTSFWGDLELEWTTRFKEKLHKEKKLIRRVGGLFADFSVLLWLSRFFPQIKRML